jgi:uncharacterized phage protein gp47/JayE
MATTIAPTFDDLFKAGRAEAINRTPSLTFDEGDISEMEMAAAAAMGDHVTEYAANRVKATFLDGAFGDDLTTLADDRYGLQREPAVAATVLMTFHLTSAGPSGTIPAGTVVSTLPDSQGNQIQFTTDTDLGWANTDTTKTVSATCTQLGVLGDVAPNTITRLVTTGLFAGFTVFNAAYAAGGADEESDDSLKDRCRTFYSTLRRGTLAAIEFGARQVAGVANATAVEPGDGTVNLFVSDASGNSSPSMLTAVATEEDNWRSGGVVVNVYGGSVFTIPTINVSLTLRPGVSVSLQDVQNAVAGRVSKLKIGEDLSPTLIKNAVATVDPDGILDVTVNVPAGTVSAVDGFGRRSVLLRTLPANVSVS